MEDTPSSLGKVPVFYIDTMVHETQLPRHKN